ncbi:2-dehydro-3-deoxyphosphogalactonate aldolase [Candidatus Rhodobacter oscarellae]|uniref:2-dehydro-3-deoxyphosphogalactonate aldolase n=1 Tax=Candidatus Rhodobacter oscarellae TaxID=1675527 RepID=A0A0J9E6D2_9RHOB|nr:2-dehydro-3-deoxy-6-phosphogalactonate aldolase [Candidatus Rhodobacter lobularis]KMW58330.1 2-dehydro-3-deoxyphosphogalactonate aldolase [Candidatus Rhodobacter lobularis]
MTSPDMYRLIAILRGLNPERAEETGSLLIETGINTIEVPLNRPGALEAIERLARAFGDQALIGAGTVLTAEDVQRVKDAGGQIVVSPDCNPEIIRATKAAGMISAPGVFTATEAFTALRAGADILKTFPANVLKPSGLKALRAVLPAEAPVVAVGSIPAESFGDWVAAGASGFGLGSLLFDPSLETSELRTRADALTGCIDKVFSS